MSDCCDSKGVNDEETIQSCPTCGTSGKLVQRITLGALLTPDARKRISQGDGYRFCAMSECDTVYFKNKGDTFKLNDIAVNVGQKRNDENRTVCYCFGHQEKDVARDFKDNHGKSTIIDEVKRLVKSGNCFCEVTNPQGSCCLGNLSAVVKKEQSC